jgi:hypothetical protein
MQRAKDLDIRAPEHPPVAVAGGVKSVAVADFNQRRREVLVDPELHRRPARGLTDRPRRGCALAYV